MPKTQQEIIRQGYQALVNSLGVVDAIRFIHNFIPVQGDYTKERHDWLDQSPLEHILTSMRQRREDGQLPHPARSEGGVSLEKLDETQYDEIITSPVGTLIRVYLSY